MNSGKTLFAQLMDFLPWSTFTRIVSRYGGDWRVRTLSCAEQYRAMAFAQWLLAVKPDGWCLALESVKGDHFEKSRGLDQRVWTGCPQTVARMSHSPFIFATLLG